MPSESTYNCALATKGTNNKSAIPKKYNLAFKFLMFFVFKDSLFGLFYILLGYSEVSIIGNTVDAVDRDSVVTCR